MVAIPPDSPEPAELGGQEETSQNEGPKAKNIKVVLDIEDAPFLQENEPKPEPAKPLAVEPEAELPAEEEVARPGRLQRIKNFLFGSKKRLIILVAVLVLVLGGAGGGVFFLLSGPGTPKGEEPAKGGHDKPAPRVIVLNSTLPVSQEPVPYMHLVLFEPFTVPMTGSEGETRFLSCTIAVGAETDAQRDELTGRMLQIRDALYYFLINRPLTLLQSELATEHFKQDLVSVINEHLTIEKIRQIYLQDYLVIGP